MTGKNTTAAFVFAAALLVSADAGLAAPMTIYDPTSRTYITYDPDKVRRDAFGPRGPASERSSAVTPARTVSVAPSARTGRPDPIYDRQIVAYDGDEAPGTIVIDTGEKFLYFVVGDGRAVRMGVGVGREGFGWTGTTWVGGKQVEPKWFPPPEMVEREPELAEYVAEGMPGGEGNPLGVRAIYLHDDAGKDTLYRIHGTSEPWSIGHNVSSGCIRMLNEHVVELYDMVEMGATVIVR